MTNIEELERRLKVVTDPDHDYVKDDDDLLSVAEDLFAALKEVQAKWDNRVVGDELYSQTKPYMGLQMNHALLEKENKRLRVAIEKHHSDFCDYARVHYDKPCTCWVGKALEQT